MLETTNSSAFRLCGAAPLRVNIALEVHSHLTHALSPLLILMAPPIAPRLVLLDYLATPFAPNIAQDE